MATPISHSRLSSGPKILVALDYSSREACLHLVSSLDPSLCRLKIGKEMFTLFGPQLVEEVQQRGFDVFLDLKFHDIPNTVAKAVSAAAKLGVWMVNVHASGGARMLEAAKNALANYSRAPLLIAVTVLTSMDEEDLQSIGVTCSPLEHALRLAELSKQSGLDGVVCSAHEVEKIKLRCGSDFLCVTPGIRLASSETSDQRRIMTPEQAVKAGSDYLVIGRPITEAADPAAVLQNIHFSINTQTGAR